MSKGSDGVAPGARFRALAVSLRVGALYDFVFAGLMLAAPDALEGAFALPLPGEAFYLRLLAILLTMAGVTYLIAARDPETFRPLVTLAVVARFAGAVALAASAFGEPRLAGLWGPALGDFGFAVVHAALGRRLWR
jgi:hypothetical protein